MLGFGDVRYRFSVSSDLRALDSRVRTRVSTSSQRGVGLVFAGKFGSCSL